MTRVRIKICGITRAEDAELACERGADAVGFVFWPGSPRHVAPDAARRIGDSLPARVTRVGVFVNAEPAAVAGTVQAAALDAVQLHGDEPVDRFRTSGARLIKAVRLRNPGDVARAAALPADITVLVDAIDPIRRGGSGRQADWTLAAELARRRPIWLAGGLRPENVADAIRAVRPDAIDVSSGVERAPGVKDPERLVALFEAVARVHVEET